jgi:sucrose phosphorylase
MAAGHAPDAALRRHLAAHAIMLALRGIPALYVHSLVASGNDREGFERTGEPRALNRRRFDDVDAFRRDLGTNAAWQGLRQMLEWRASTAAFHPESDQTVLDTPEHVFAVERTAAAGPRARVHVNVSGAPAAVDAPPGGGWRAAGTAEPVPAGTRLTLAPWSSLWLTAD